ncbi:MAG: methyl-accepting chemotaxis protein, partial [Tissierellaceae bacterium]
MTPESIIIGIGVVVILFLGWNLVSARKKHNEAREMMDYMVSIDSVDFHIPEGASISKDLREEIYNLNKRIMGKLKTQVEISTDVFFVSEKLNTLATESLETSENIAVSVETADENITNQSKMLRDTKDLTGKIHQSMDKIGEEVIDKIQFISGSIVAAQGGIEGITDIETMIKNSRDTLQDISNKTAELRDYSHEVVNLMDLINNISNQTKMLSLNASIEAARAG